MEMMFLEERRVSKSPDRHCIALQFVAHIRCPEAVANAGKPGRARAVALLDGVDPFRNRGISKGCVLALPGLVVKVRIVCMAVFAMFPNGVL